MDSKIGHNDEIITLYSKAEKKASTLGIDLKHLYENSKVRNDYGKKNKYDQILTADSSGALNGFLGISKELESISLIMSLSNSLSYKNLDEMDKEIVDQAISLICSYFEHINKWINIEKENNA
ncbi:hypothetical protein OAD83_01440 [Gammaproteobacteria bacterium]|nr:hypothetical protein [Gammaproteobacteria bacterium]